MILRKWPRRLFRILGTIGFLFAVELLFARSLLCVDSGPQRGDVIIIPGGGEYDRVPRALELFKAGAAPAIVICGHGDCKQNYADLVAAGVPAAVIQIECLSTSTKENAEFTAPLLRAAGVKKAIIVTSWFHSRRALNTFRAVVPGVQFVSVPAYHSYRFYLVAALKVIFKEYPKLAWYWLRWGIPPWERAARADAGTEAVRWSFPGPGRDNGHPSGAVGMSPPVARISEFAC